MLKKKVIKMHSIVLLTAVTLFYAGYNLFVKLSGQHVPQSATTTILAAICIQLAALSTSVAFAAFLMTRGPQDFTLSSGSYFWAVIAGLCIGAAEIGYLYLFGGVGLSKPMSASIAIPTIVSGTIVIALIFSVLVLNEVVGLYQVIGAGLVIGGIVFMFMGGSGTAYH